MYAFALAQARLANKDIPGAIEAFRVAHRAALSWFAPKEAFENAWRVFERKQIRRRYLYINHLYYRSLSFILKV